MTASLPYFREFFRLREAVDRNVDLARFWRWLALECAQEVGRCERTAADCARAALKVAARGFHERQLEESRVHADRLAEIEAFLESGALDGIEADVVRRLEEDRG
jgi:hypothetical protein